MNKKILGYADLNSQKRRICAQFLNDYNDESKSVALTLLVGGMGESSFKAVCQKLYLLINDTPAMQKYYDALYALFKENEMETLGSIIAKVTKARRECGLQLFITSLDKQCLDACNRLYIIEVKTEQVPTINKNGEPSSKTVKVGYTPIFRLKPLQQL